MFQTKMVEKIKTHIFSGFSFLFSQILPFMRYVEKYYTAGISQMTIWHMHVAC